MDNESKYRVNHKGSSIAGRPGLRWKNEGWIDDEKIYPDDALAHNGSSYKATVFHISTPATEPGLGAGWQNVWQLIAGADQELVTKNVIQTTGATLLKGRAITAVGNHANGSVIVDYATAADPISAINCFGVLAGDLPDFDLSNGFIGKAVIIGEIVDYDTSQLTAGTRSFLSNDVPATGKLTSIPPVSPDYLIELGGTQVSDPDNGVQFITVENRGANSGVLKIFNGAILEDHHVTVTSDGVDITLTLTDAGAEFLSLFYSAKFFRLPVPATVTLTAGTDEAEAFNYIYVPDSTRQLTANLTGFPIDEQFTPIATCAAFSVLRTQIDGGPLSIQAWTDHLADAVGQGHLSHLNAWVRRTQPASWQNGILPTFTGSGTGNVSVAFSAGEVDQLHPHQIPAFPGPADFLVSNSTVLAPSLPQNNFADLLLDSTGATLANRSFPLVLRGLANESPAPDKFIVNLPSGSYPASQPDVADKDLDGFADFGIPKANLNNGYLVWRLIASFNAAGTVLTLHDYDRNDLRAGEGASGGAGTVNSLPATAITFIPVGLWASVEVQALGLEISDYITNPNPYQITGVLERLNPPIIVAVNGDLDISTDPAIPAGPRLDHVGDYTLPATGTTNIDYFDIPAGRQWYKTLDFTITNLAALTTISKAAINPNGDPLDIGLWLVDNLVEDATTTVIWRQKALANGDQRINLSIVQLAQ